MSENKKQTNEVVSTKKHILPLIIPGVVVALMIAFVVVLVIKAGRISPENKLAEQLDLGEKYLSELNYEQAITAYEVAIEIDPMSVDAYLGLASVYEAQEDFEKAKSVLEEGYLATNDGILKQRLDEFYAMFVVEEENNSESVYEAENVVVYDIIDADGDGKHDSDVEVLNTIINEQLALGATVDSNIDSEQYVWVSGRLTEIHWIDKALVGNISFTGLEKLSTLECLSNTYSASQPGELLKYSFLDSIDVSQNVELIHFNCAGNNIISIDVSNIRKLEYLNCSANLLDSIDVSNNKELTSLLCADNTITNLDISNNIKLKDFYCSNNKLTMLDVSNNLELIKLVCYSNEINNIDVTKNNKLTLLSCGSNPLSGLDVRSNYELEDLYCSGCELTSLDLSNNLKLKDLSCGDNSLGSLDLSIFTELESLDCSNSGLTSLDVSKNTKLWYLHCGDNPIEKLDLSNNLNLEWLFCYRTNVANLDLSNNKKLTLFSCSSHTLYSGYEGQVDIFD